MSKAFQNASVRAKERETIMDKCKIHVELLGSVYTISKLSIPSGDTSRLAEFFRSSETQSTFTFNRSRESFEAILKYFETGELHIPKTVCPGEFMMEMNFWKIDVKKLSRCCKLKLLIYKQNANNMENYSKREIKIDDAKQNLQKKPVVEITRRCLSDVLEQRSNIYLAKVYHGFLTLMVLASVFLIALSSLPELRTAIEMPGVKNTSLDPIPVKHPNDNQGSFACSTKTFKSCTDIQNFVIREQRRICKAFDTAFPNVSEVEKFEFFDIVQTFCIEATVGIVFPFGIPDDIFMPMNNNGKKECDETFCAKWEVWDNLTNLIYSKCEDVTTKKMKVPVYLTEKVNIFCKKIRIKIQIEKPLLHSTVIVPRLAKVKTLIENNNAHLLYFEFVLSAFFTCEYFIRFACCTDKLQYLILPLNIIDLLALTVGYLRYVLYSFGLDISTENFDILLYLQMFRIFRLFRPLQSVRAFRIFNYSLQKGKHELFLIFLFTFIGMIVFSNLLYFAEDESQFHSIPDAWWWCIVTMTTVGYGDMYPATVVGKLIGGACALYGVIIYALTIPMFVKTFNDMYKFAFLEAEELY